MLFNLKITLRNLMRGGIYSVINIGGLAIGMAASILILAWIYHEWSYDRFHAKEKQLYVVYHRATAENGNIRAWAESSKILGPTLKADYPEIVRTTRSAGTELLFTREEANFKNQTGFADTDFLSMFDFPLLQGSSGTSLNDPYSVVLTEKAAMRLFGADDPMGKTMMVNRQYPVTVTGVMKDLPGNTQFQFDALMPMAFLKVLDRYDEGWTNWSCMTYVELHPHASPDLVNESVRDIIKKHADGSSRAEIFLFPLGKKHLYSQFENGIPVGGALMEKMRLYSVIVCLTLLIACINFTNLSTARSQKRAKETGVRKVMGGKRWSLVGLFLGESLMVAFIAGAGALFLALMALPVFGTLMGAPLTINLADGRFWLAGLAFVVLTGLLAGCYPAFYLSSFRPVKVLKGVFNTKQRMISPRKVLVVTQFAVACGLIASTWVIYRQINHAQLRESGYNKDNLIYT